ncbi:hypothetical protein IF1G_08537 [Cordyceps javanica]|uniref:Uncharacterized protein n=1 Tax=Cordyceps javanica TaxID=43265 RepID=A0A545UT28_9HYPO|nr:hypothetical protein IF1G_08537 [Cordyceps javanica]
MPAADPFPQLTGDFPASNSSFPSTHLFHAHLVAAVYKSCAYAIAVAIIVHACETSSPCPAIQHCSSNWPLRAFLVATSCFLLQRPRTALRWVIRHQLGI